MPMYDFKCEAGHKFERMVRLVNYGELQHCNCGELATRQISAPQFTVDSTDYSCPVTGRRIASKHEHEENLKRTDSRVLEPGEKEANQKNREAAESAFDKTIEDSVERELSSWGSDKMEKLSNELVNGNVDLKIERL